MSTGPGGAGAGGLAATSVCRSRTPGQEEFPGHFLRHSDFDVQLAHNDGSTRFAADAAFRKVAVSDAAFRVQP
ncbi:AbfB domain-containing protein [Streptomyces sp. LUP30]|uniref:AbfB domain-containing protein n=1 Tax=Streptomyces sp. LUP30 TaxID=1890285 RepID=UPI000851DCA7